MSVSSLIPLKTKIAIYKLLQLCHFAPKDINKDYFVAEIDKESPWAYVGYIADVFYHKDDEGLLSSHQNKREALVIVETLNELGYNVYVQNYTSESSVPDIDFKIVFGHEPNFTRIALKCPDALKIHYVPGAYIDHRNGQIIRMTDYFNKTYNASVPYRRLLEYKNPEHASKVAYDIADKILLIGSKYTIATFPSNIQKKITKIHQSTQQIHATCIENGSSKDFFFMGSGGNLLKGLSLLIEYFNTHKEYTIHIVGPIEEDVKAAIGHMLTTNIKLYGFLDVNSDQMCEIMSKCNFVLYPSGSEGMPGSVLNSMKRGLIPIVTKWSAFDEIEELGYVLENWDVESIAKGVDWAQSLTDNIILNRKKMCSNYVYETYNLDRFKREFKDFLIESINEYKIEK